MKLPYQFMNSDFSYQFYLPVEYYAIRKEYKECKGEYEKYISKN